MTSAEQSAGHRKRLRERFLKGGLTGFADYEIVELLLSLGTPRRDVKSQAKEALKPGGYLGSILPTTNQVSILLIALRRANFAFIEVCEIILRYYKAVADRLRPTDRMVAHTGYLIFSRSVFSDDAAILESDQLTVDDD